MHGALRPWAFVETEEVPGVSLEHLVSSREQVANKLFLQQQEGRLPLVQPQLGKRWLATTIFCCSSNDCKNTVTIY